ncbi:MAG TPA: peptidylprolyl isomerase [Natronosporangium sp.]
MSSTKERQQRAAARARLARQMAERQAAARKRRQRRLAISGAVALVVVVAGTFWIVNAVTDDESTPAAASTPTPSASAGPASPGPCVWNEQEPSDTVVDVGVPPSGEPRAGSQTMTVSTNHGDIVVSMDLAASPCIAASFSHLADQEFYDGTKCHRMFPGMLQCGDPTAKGEGYRETDGRGGPSYRFANENLPTWRGGMAAGDPYYPAGTVAMANSGPDTNGSQFFFIYQDTDLDGPNYSIVGEIVEGMDVLEEIDAIGHDGAFDPNPGGGHPNEDIIIESLRVSPPVA